MKNFILFTIFMLVGTFSYAAKNALRCQTESPLHDGGKVYGFVADNSGNNLFKGKLILSLGDQLSQVTIAENIKVMIDDTTGLISETSSQIPIGKLMMGVDTQIIIFRPVRIDANGEIQLGKEFFCKLANYNPDFLLKMDRDLLN